MSETTTKVNLFDYDRKALENLLADLGEPRFRATQLLQWLHRDGVTDFQAMSNLSKNFREKLVEKVELRLPEIVLDNTAADGTRKWLCRMFDGNCIEMVFIPTDDRGTLCVSSQVGCALNCSFCATGKQGFSRNLTVAEIIGQLWQAVRLLSKDNKRHDRQVTNVVMMGMGEPLLNFDAVVAATNLMLDEFAYGLSKYRVTISTSGLVPEMQRLREISPVALAVSLHAPDDGLRNQIVPINKKYNLKSLIDICKIYYENETKRFVTFEYVMLKNVNDSLAHAKKLLKLLAGVRCKINLIPFNPFPGTEYQCSDADTILNFQRSLQQGGIVTTIRQTRGDPIAAACGQLVGNFSDRTGRKARIEKQKRKNDAA